MFRGLQKSESGGLLELFLHRRGEVGTLFQQFAPGGTVRRVEVLDRYPQARGSGEVLMDEIQPRPAR